MAEQLMQSPEKHEAEFDPEHLLPTAEQAEPLREGEPSPEELAETARAEVEEAAVEDDPIARLAANEASATEDSRPTQVNNDLKATTLRRELQQIRRKLPVADRTLSRVIHQPAVRVISEATGKSISRPSGLLGGGLMAFVGSLGYLYLAKHIGFTYNYFVFILLFLSGFVLGLLLEFVIWGATARHRNPDS